jgi:D-alanine transaminase
MDNIVFLNGKFIDKSKASISIMDRGFLFGDGVYELIPVYKSRIFLLDKHLARLRSSLNHINIDSESVGINNIGDVINDIIEKNKILDSFIYVHITRGAQSPRNHVYQSDLKPTTLVMGENYNIFSKEQIMRGFEATVQTDFRWTKSHIKSISLLGNVLLKNHANDNNFYETLLIRDDLLTEGAASNVFIVEDDKVITPKLSENLLPGVTRDLIINLARQSGKQIFEEDISSDRLVGADEIWCSSSTNYVVPITKVDDVDIQNGKVGDTTKEFYNLVTKYIQEL